MLATPAASVRYGQNNIWTYFRSIVDEQASSAAVVGRQHFALQGCETRRGGGVSSMISASNRSIMIRQLVRVALGEPMSDRQGFVRAQVAEDQAHCRPSRTQDT